MKNYYIIKKIIEKDLPYPEMFSSFDNYGFSQMEETVENGDIYICTDGSEIDDEQIIIDLGEIDDLGEIWFIQTLTD